MEEKFEWHKKLLNFEIVKKKRERLHEKLENLASI